MGETFVPLLLLGGAAVYFLGMAIHTARMTPLEWEEERRRLLPNTTLWEDIKSGRRFD